VTGRRSRDRSRPRAPRSRDRRCRPDGAGHPTRGPLRLVIVSLLHCANVATYGVETNGGTATPDQGSFVEWPASLMGARKAGAGAHRRFACSDRR
jgi:hypothetical protein